MSKAKQRKDSYFNLGYRIGLGVIEAPNINLYNQHHTVLKAGYKKGVVERMAKLHQVKETGYEDF